MLEAAMLAYTLVSFAAIVMTYREQRQAGVTTPLFRMTGFMLCTFWPAALMLLASAKALRRF